MEGIPGRRAPRAVARQPFALLGYLAVDWLNVSGKPGAYPNGSEAVGATDGDDEE